MSSIRNLAGTLVVAALFVSTSAQARGPGIYSHTLTRTHSQSECMNRAGAVANKHNFVVEGDSVAMSMTRNNGTMSYQIRCDIPHVTLFVSSGPDDQLRSGAQTIMNDYNAADLGH